MRLEGYEVYFVSNGKKQREYGVNTKSPVSDEDALQSTCWIQSSSEQNFYIMLRDELHTYDLRGTLFVDGQIAKSWTTGTNEEQVCVSHVYTSPTTIAPLKFVPIRASTNDGQASTSTQPSTPGLITIRLQRGRRSENVDRRNTPPIIYSVPRAVDGMAREITHQVGTGDSVPWVGEPLWDFEISPHYGTALYFNFHYRSEDALRALGLGNRPQQSASGDASSSSYSRKAGAHSKISGSPPIDAERMRVNGHSELAESSVEDDFSETVAKRRDILQERYDALNERHNTQKKKIDVLEEVLAASSYESQDGAEPSGLRVCEEDTAFIASVKAETERLKKDQVQFTHKNDSIKRQLALLEAFVSLDTRERADGSAMGKKRKLS